MARRSRRTQMDDIRLDMTPMIDCVFQLLIFFLVSMKFEDVMAHLDVNRPSPEREKKVEDKVVDMVTIGVFVDGITLNQKPMGLPRLEAMLLKLAALDKTQTILIQCAPDSPHERLIQVLDLCAKAGLTNLSVLSL
jgi:biopolymer transport protein ExbD